MSCNIQSVSLRWKQTQLVVASTIPALLKTLLSLKIPLGVVVVPAVMGDPEVRAHPEEGAGAPLDYPCQTGDAPEASTCLGVFGVSYHTAKQELEKEFSKFGPLQKVQVVLDGKTGRSRGFAFVYFEAMEDAKAAKDAMCDTEIDGRKIRVDYSITKRSHTPTPGVYMGKPT